ncbi:Uncharacterised protein [uncultured archaeon]|nr:Uncharacterised protein [uncultured archaeon]
MLAALPAFIETGNGVEIENVPVLVLTFALPITLASMLPVLDIVSTTSDWLLPLSVIGFVAFSEIERVSLHAERFTWEMKIPLLATASPHSVAFAFTVNVAEAGTEPAYE